MKTTLLKYQYYYLHETLLSKRWSLYPKNLRLYYIRRLKSMSIFSSSSIIVVVLLLILLIEATVFEIWEWGFDDDDDDDVADIVAVLTIRLLKYRSTTCATLFRFILILCLMLIFKYRRVRLLVRTLGHTLG